MTDNLTRRVQELGFGLLETDRGFDLLEPTTGHVVRRGLSRDALEAWLYRLEADLFDPVFLDTKNAPRRRGSDLFPGRQGGPITTWGRPGSGAA